MIYYSNVPKHNTSNSFRDRGKKNLQTVFKEHTSEYILTNSANQIQLCDVFMHSNNQLKKTLNLTCGKRSEGMGEEGGGGGEEGGREGRGCYFRHQTTKHPSHDIFAQRYWWSTNNNIDDKLLLYQIWFPLLLVIYSSANISKKSTDRSFFKKLSFTSIINPFQLNISTMKTYL